MNYELAKRLKDAGFPQKGEYIFAIEKGKSTWMSFHAAVLDEDGYAFSSKSDVICPTLSELIEACGDDFTNLTLVAREYKGLDENGQRKYNVESFPKWVCGWSTNGVNSLSDEWEQEGSTPEEAVANLWLALNEKKV